MKASEIRQMPTNELLERLAQERANLANMKFQASTSQLTNTSRISIVRKDVARMMTVIKERAKTGADAS